MLLLASLFRKIRLPLGLDVFHEAVDWLAAGRDIGDPVVLAGRRRAGKAQEKGTCSILFGPILAPTNSANKYRPGNRWDVNRDGMESSVGDKNERIRAAANDTRRWTKTVGYHARCFDFAMCASSSSSSSQPTKVVTDHLVRAKRRLAAGPKTDQHAGDDRHVRLNIDALGLGARQMETAGISVTIRKTPTDSLSDPIATHGQPTLRCTFSSSLACWIARSKPQIGLKRNGSTSEQY